MSLNVVSRYALIVGLSFFAVNTANAKLPDNVAEAYKTYETSLAAQNFGQAEIMAFKAWMAAEDTLGDSKVTGDLAQNYADILAFNKGSFSMVKKAYRRASDLSDFYPEEERFNVKMDRTISLSAYANSVGRLRQTRSDLDRVINVAEASNVGPSTYLGEIYTLRAGAVSLSRNPGFAKAFGERAEAIFSSSQDGVYSPYSKIASEFANLKISRFGTSISEQTAERSSATETAPAPSFLTAKPR